MTLVLVLVLVLVLGIGDVRGVRARVNAIGGVLA